MRSETPDGDRDHRNLDQQAWDTNDPRRRDDPFAPPAEPCECCCIHCHRTFSSGKIWFQKINGGRPDFQGFWLCPTPNCDGKGFTFDIFPTDPNHPANEDCYWNDDGDEEEEPDEYGWLDELDDDDETDYEFLGLDDPEPETEYDPAEPQYQMLDQWAGDDDDIEGEEWKHGLEPGQRLEPTKPDWVIEEEKKYDEPDRRPREVDWTETPELGSIEEDDIPF